MAKGLAKEINAQRRKDAQAINETFSTPAGQRTWTMLMAYYDQMINPDMPADQVKYHAGQRDVVQWLLNSRRSAGFTGQTPRVEDISDAPKD